MRHPRRERQHADLVVAQVEFVQAHQAVAALVGHLVVHHHFLDGVAEGIGLGQVRGAVVVAVERHEDLIIVADQLVPQHQAVRHFQRRDAVFVDVQQLVVDQDDGQRRVGADDLVGPRQRGVGNAPRQ
ncbi:hypothetical protein D3C71_1432550 [compost metagenome]